MQYTGFFSPVKIENFMRKILIFFLFLLKTLIVGTRRGGSNEYPQSMLVYPCIPQFYCLKVGFEGVFIARTCFPDELKCLVYRENILLQMNLALRDHICSSTEP